MENFINQLESELVDKIVAQVLNEEKSVFDFSKEYGVEPSTIVGYIEHSLNERYKSIKNDLMNVNADSEGILHSLQQLRAQLNSFMSKKNIAFECEAQSKLTSYIKEFSIEMSMFGMSPSFSPSVDLLFDRNEIIALYYYSFLPKCVAKLDKLFFDYFVSKNNSFVALRLIFTSPEQLITHSEYDVAGLRMYSSFYDLYKLMCLSAETLEDRVNVAIMDFLLGDIAYSNFLLTNIIRFEPEWHSYKIGSKLLYYFVLTGNILNINNSDEEFKWWYHFIQTKENKSEEDFYYMGLIQDIVGYEAPGYFFDNAGNNKYACICKDSINLCGEDRYNYLNNLVPKKKKFDLRDNIWKQIEDYSHIIECRYFVSGEIETKYKFNKIFSLAEEDKSPYGTLKKRLNMIRAEREKQIFNDSISLNIKGVDEKKKEQLEIMKNLLNNVDGNVRDGFYHLGVYVSQIENKEFTDTVANQIALTIEQYVFEKEDVYLMYIWYFYHSGKITFQDVTDLCLYLMYVSLRFSRNNKVEGIVSASMSMINVGVNITDSIFVLIMPLFNMSFWDSIKKIYHSCLNEFDRDKIVFKTESEYRTFIRFMWQKINELSKSKGKMFKQREYIDDNLAKKINQVDKFLKERMKQNTRVDDIDKLGQSPGRFSY